MSEEQHAAACEFHFRRMALEAGPGSVVVPVSHEVTDTHRITIVRIGETEHMVQSPIK